MSKDKKIQYTFDGEKLFTKEQILNKLKDWQFVNPTLVSDGRGEFSDVYKLNSSNLKDLENLLK